jgi:hypothetical protein
VTIADAVNFMMRSGAGLYASEDEVYEVIRAVWVDGYESGLEDERC